MVIEPPSSAKKGDQARIETPIIPFIEEGYCFSWFYHMLGPDIGKLNIYVKSNDKIGLFWSFGENVGNIWNSGQVTIPKISDYKNFTILIEGK